MTPRYNLRTLLILLAVLPPLPWFGWTAWIAAASPGCSGRTIAIRVYLRAAERPSSPAAAAGKTLDLEKP